MVDEVVHIGQAVAFVHQSADYILWNACRTYRPHCPLLQKIAGKVGHSDYTDIVVSSSAIAMRILFDGIHAVQGEPSIMVYQDELVCRKTFGPSSKQVAMAIFTIGYFSLEETDQFRVHEVRTR